MRIISENRILTGTLVLSAVVEYGCIIGDDFPEPGHDIRGLARVVEIDDEHLVAALAWRPGPDPESQGSISVVYLRALPSGMLEEVRSQIVLSEPDWRIGLTGVMPHSDGGTRVLGYVRGQDPTGYRPVYFEADGSMVDREDEGTWGVSFCLDEFFVDYEGKGDRSLLCFVEPTDVSRSTSFVISGTVDVVVRRPISWSWATEARGEWPFHPGSQEEIAWRASIEYVAGDFNHDGLAEVTRSSVNIDTPATGAVWMFDRAELDRMVLATYAVVGEPGEDRLFNMRPSRDGSRLVVFEVIPDGKGGGTLEPIEIPPLPVHGTSASAVIANGRRSALVWPEFEPYDIVAIDFAGDEPVLRSLPVPKSSTFADVDGDGDDDCIADGPAGLEVWWNEDGTFVEPERPPPQLMPPESSLVIPTR